jgi:hypothetical protein
MTTSVQSVPLIPVSSPFGVSSQSLILCELRTGLYHLPACCVGLIHGSEHGDHLDGGRQYRIGHSASVHASTSAGLCVAMLWQAARSVGTLPAADCSTHDTVRCRTLPSPQSWEHGDHGSVTHSAHCTMLLDGVGEAERAGCFTCQKGATNVRHKAKSFPPGSVTLRLHHSQQHATESKGTASPGVMEGDILDEPEVEVDSYVTGWSRQFVHMGTE